MRLSTPIRYKLARNCICDKLSISWQYVIYTYTEIFVPLKVSLLVLLFWFKILDNDFLPYILFGWFHLLEHINYGDILISWWLMLIHAVKWSTIWDPKPFDSSDIMWVPQYKRDNVTGACPFKILS